MWPFAEMTLPSATFWSSVSNIVIVASLLVGVLATFASMNLSNIKERYWDIAREKSQERIAELEVETATAKLELAKAVEKTAQLSADAEASRTDIAKANERAALAEQKAAEATLELAKLTTPRTLNDMQKSIIAKAVQSYSGTSFIIGVHQGAEPILFAEQISDALQQGGWIEKTWDGAGDVRLGNYGIVNVVGIFIQVDNIASPNMERAVMELGSAVAIIGIKPKIEKRNFPQGSKEVIRLLVGAKNP